MKIYIFVADYYDWLLVLAFVIVAVQVCDIAIKSTRGK
jgi:hypothetical protein